MKKKIKDFLRAIFLEKITYRDYNFKVKKNDIFIISYPKSGNTWMRFLLANLFTNRDINFDNIEEIIIDIYKKKNSEIKKANNLQIFKSHSFFRPKFSSNKVIYMVRDVRDVVISYYYYYKKVNKIDIEFNKFFDMFIKGQVDNYGTWGENVGSWLGAKKKNDNFLLIRYEDMLNDTYKEVKKVCNFLKLEVSKSDMKQAIENSSFDNLKQKEVEVEDEAIELKNSSKNIKFFRKGKSNQWKDFLSSEQLKIINNQFGYLLKKLGYLD